LRGASQGMVSDFDLMQAASRAMMLGVSADAGQLSQLMEVAAIRGRAMGLSTTQAFNDIVTGIGRASPLILDNLGIVVDAEAGYEAYADSVGKTAEELSKAEKTQALLNGVLESSKGLLEATGGLAVDNAGKWEQLSAAQKNYFDAVKSDLADATSWWADYWAAVFTEKKQAHDLNEIWEQARELGLISAELQDAYSQYRMGGISANDTQFLLENAAAIEILGEKIDSAKTKTNDWADANYDTGASFESIAAGMAAAQAAAESEATAIQSVADATNNADAAMRAYSESLLFKIASEGLSEEGALGLAYAMGLVDQKTVAATEQVNVYRQMLADRTITQRQYNLLVEDLATNIENLPEGKNLEVTTNAEDVSAKLDDLENRKFKPKPLTVELDLDTSAVDDYSPPTKYGTVSYLPSKGMTNAVGGNVYGGNPYTWQEYGYRGELFVPSQDGYILSRAEAERALARALVEGKTGGSEIDYERLANVLSRVVNNTGSQKGGNTYNLNVQGGGSPSKDVAATFDLLRAYGGNF